MFFGATLLQRDFTFTRVIVKMVRRGGSSSGSYTWYVRLKQPNAKPWCWRNAHVAKFHSSRGRAMQLAREIATTTGIPITKKRSEVEKLSDWLLDLTDVDIKDETADGEKQQPP